jgi:hypothetical protein
MASAKDKLRVLENVIGRIGLGGDVLSEYSKALSAMSGLDTYAEMNPAPIPMPTQTQPAPQDTLQATPQVPQTIPTQDTENMV